MTTRTQPDFAQGEGATAATGPPPQTGVGPRSPAVWAGRAGRAGQSWLARLRVPSRRVHPGAWWVWALTLAVVAARTTNPLLLGLIIAVAGYVVAARRTDAPWARSYAAFLRLGLVVIAIRMVFAALVGVPLPGPVLVQLPEVTLPDWAAGVRLGGPISVSTLAAALAEGLRLATMLAALGAANALANPRRLLATLPAALYQVGVAVVVAMTFAPQLLISVTRVREARRLRGQRLAGPPGLRWVDGFRRVAMPVLHQALEGAVDLAASMDARGYGRRTPVPVRTRRTQAVATLGGLLGVCVALYGLLDAGFAPAASLGLLLAGLAGVLIGMRLGGRGAVRTRYRPDVWGAAGWTVVGCGFAALAVTEVAARLQPAAVAWSPVPLAAPDVPVLAMLGVLVAVIPAFVPATVSEVP